MDDSEAKNIVDEFERLHQFKKEIEEKSEKIRQTLILLAKQKNTNVLFGTNKTCSIKEFEKVVYPEDKEQLISIIKEKGLYDSLSSINYFKLSPKILKKEIDEEIIALTSKEKTYRVSLFDKNRPVLGR